MKQKDLLPSDIAPALGISEKASWGFARHTDRQYWPTRRPLIRGKRRLIDAPREYFKFVLKRLHRFLNAQFPPHPNAHGGVPGRSTFTSARRHLGKRCIIARDVKDCYPSISPEMIERRLRKAGFRCDTAKLLSLLLTVRGRVPQGSPASSDALNEFLRAADHAIASACGRMGADYTRVYDDLVVSVDKRDSVESVGQLLEDQIGGLGLEVSMLKRKKHGLQTREKPQNVHNLNVNDRRGVRIPCCHEAFVRSLAEAYVGSARAVTAQSLKAVAAKRNKLFGWICYIRQADFSPAPYAACLLERGDRLVRQRLRNVGLSACKGKWWLESPKRNEPQRLVQAWLEHVKATGKRRSANRNGYVVPGEVQPVPAGMAAGVVP